MENTDFLDFSALGQCFPELEHRGYHDDHLKGLHRGGMLPAASHPGTGQLLYSVPALETLLKMQFPDPNINSNENTMFRQNQRLTADQVLRLEGMGRVESPLERSRLYGLIQREIHPRNPKRAITFREYRHFRGLSRTEMDSLLQLDAHLRPLWYACHHCRTVTLFPGLIPEDFMARMNEEHDHHQTVFFSRVQDRFRMRDYQFRDPESMPDLVGVSPPIRKVCRDRSHSLGLVRLLNWLDVETLGDAARVFHPQMLASRFPDFSEDLQREFEYLLDAHGLYHATMTVADTTELAE